MTKKKSKYLTGSTPEARAGKDPVFTKVEITAEEQAMLEAVKQYSWHINNALSMKVEELNKAITKGKESMKHDDGNDVYRSMEGMLEYAERALREYKEAYDAMKKVGIE